MKKNFFILFVFISSMAFSQSVIDNPKYNAAKEIVKIPYGMSYEEYQKIQRSLDWKKIFAAALIPGYIHFYAGHTDAAWGIFAFRMVGGALIGYAMYDQLRYTNGFNFAQDGLTDELEERSQKNFVIFSVGIIMNMLGYGYDWAHGDWIIEQERNEIYFKYGIDKNTKVGLLYNPDFKIFGFNYTIHF